jgi:hypothetical protein
LLDRRRCVGGEHAKRRYQGEFSPADRIYRSMAQPPDGDLPAYARLKNRATTALDLNEEQPGIEFKRSRPWDDLWIDLTRSSMGMSNLRDGGIIIVGRPEDRSTEGITPSDLATYDPDEMRDRFDSYASPGVAVTIVQITHQGSRYLIIDVAEFVEVPVVCRKNCNRDLLNGAFYIRPLTGRPRTTIVTSAEEIRDILNRAVQKGMRRFHEAAEAAGYAPRLNSADAYRRELGELDDV